MIFRKFVLASLLIFATLLTFGNALAQSPEPGATPANATITADDEPASPDRQGHGSLLESIKHSWPELGAEEKQKILESLGEFNRGIEVEMQRQSNLESWLIPVAGIVFTFGTPIVIVALVLLYRYRRNKQRAALVSEFLQAGKEVPRELLDNSTREPTTLYQRGVTFTLIGAAVALMLGFIDGWDTASLGLIPIAYGCAQLLSWRAEKRSDNQ